MPQTFSEICVEKGGVIKRAGTHRARWEPAAVTLHGGRGTGIVSLTQCRNGRKNRKQADTGRKD